MCKLTTFSSIIIMSFLLLASFVCRRHVHTPRLEMKPAQDQQKKAQAATIVDNNRTRVEAVRQQSREQRLAARRNRAASSFPINCNGQPLCRTAALPVMNSSKTQSQLGVGHQQPVSTIHHQNSQNLQ
jgi:hypothetical protein